MRAKGQSVSGRRESVRRRQRIGERGDAVEPSGFDRFIRPLRLIAEVRDVCHDGIV
jgi:hypothetical protein